MSRDMFGNNLTKADSFGASRSPLSADELQQKLVEALKSAWATIDALVGDLQEANAWNIDGGEQLYTTRETQEMIDAALLAVGVQRD